MIAPAPSQLCGNPSTMYGPSFSAGLPPSVVVWIVPSRAAATVPLAKSDALRVARSARLLPALSSFDQAIAAPIATFASVTVLLASVVAELPAEVVTAPVNAGNRAATSVPLDRSAALRVARSARLLPVLSSFDQAIAAPVA